MRKKASSVSPSLRVIILAVAVGSRTRSSTMKERTKLASSISGISRFSVPRVMEIGATRAVTPPMARMLKRLLPTTFPSEMSALPLRAEVRLTMSSGEEVPKATMVSPTTSGDTPKRRASVEAPSVR